MDSSFCKHKQEAQLPVRNRASAMYIFVAKLLSIAVMTYSYVYHLGSLSDDTAFVTHTAFDVSFLGNPYVHPQKLYIVRN